ncbi:MAG TPA: universal stress protein [Anaerolineae bacterium]|nr:universal stress protein [Anaerolineae bacterium]
MGHVSRKLSTAWEGALAGGGDPATSPLYVFGPFLKLIVVAGVAEVTFGASLWLVVVTVAVVSMMYRLVMQWVTDGSGGSGLSEEEFGSWAVKLNAGITFVEYTLTFLVSMAALVTFIADRLPVLNEPLGPWQYRTVVAIGLSLLTGWLVNRGPKVAAWAFGPATAGILALLWVMIFTTIYKMGFHLPSFDLEAFSPEYIGFTFNGYVRILAVMTGIEVFANLVAAYEGPPRERSNKAFGSLLIIMGTTCLTMLIVGPAIYQLADVNNEHVSVFTQTMDLLLPAPLAWAGTLVGVAVLLSASAASAQGLQNLALGLKFRHYIPASMGSKNQFGVADKPVWLEVGLVAICFLLLGTEEETYLAIYAAGVFILLSMTGWAAAKRLGRQLWMERSVQNVVMLAGVTLAATMTTGATVIIFVERFFEGAWTYFLFLPILYILFSYFRNELGAPTDLEERLGILVAGSGPLATRVPRWEVLAAGELPVTRLLVPLDQSSFGEQALPLAEMLAAELKVPVTLAHVMGAGGDEMASQVYLAERAAGFAFQGEGATIVVGRGKAADSLGRVAAEHGADLVVMSTHGYRGVKEMVMGSVAQALVGQKERPVLLVRPVMAGGGQRGKWRRVLVTLDGSPLAEASLGYAVTLAKRLGCELLLVSVPESPDEVAAQGQIKRYLEGIAAVLGRQGIQVKTEVRGNNPAVAIAEMVAEEGVDLVLMATHGRQGVARLLLGSIAAAVVANVACPVMLIPSK